MRFLSRTAQWALLDQATVSATNFLLSILIARSLDEHGLASFSLASTLLFGLFSVHRALIAQPMNILGAQDQPLRRFGRYMNMLHAQKGVLPACALCLGLVGWWFFPQLALVLGVMVYLSVFCLQDLVRRYHYTDGHIVKAIPGDMLAYLGQLLLLTACWQLFGLTIESVFWLMSIPVALAAWSMHQGIVRSQGKASNQDPSTPSPSGELKGHWHNAKWVVMSQIVWIGASQLVPFQLASFANTSDVAAYHAAGTLMNVFNVFRMTIGNYLPARAASVLHVSGVSGLRHYLGQVSMAFLVLTALGCAVFYAIGGVLIEFLYDDRYPGAALIVPALAAVNLLGMAALVTTAGAQVLGISRIIFTSNAVAMVLTLALSPWLMTHWGLWGAVWTLAIGLLLPTFVQALHVERALRPSRKSTP